MNEKDFSKIETAIASLRNFLTEPDISTEMRIQTESLLKLLEEDLERARTIPQTP